MKPNKKEKQTIEVTAAQADLLAYFSPTDLPEIIAGMDIIFDTTLLYYCNNTDRPTGLDVFAWYRYRQLLDCVRALA